MKKGEYFVMISTAVAAAALGFVSGFQYSSKLSSPAPFDAMSRQHVGSELILRLNKEYQPWRNSLPQRAFCLKVRPAEGGDWRTLMIFPESRVDMLTTSQAKGLPNGVLIHVAIEGRQNDQLFIDPNDHWEFTR